MDAKSSEILRRFFVGIAEQTFQTQLGVADPKLIDYISNLLVRFVKCDALYKIRGLKGTQFTQVTQMLAEAEFRVGEAKREIHRHIGDFTLFWSGVYPESLALLQDSTSRDHLVDYCTQGKRAYWIASTFAGEPDGDVDENKVLIRLSREFEMCAYGLREVRRVWENGDQFSGPYIQPVIL